MMLSILLMAIAAELLLLVRSTRAAFAPTQKSLLYPSLSHTSLCPAPTLANTNALALHDARNEQSAATVSHASESRAAKRWDETVQHGLTGLLAMFSLPLYGVAFGLLGYKTMWAVSEWFYGLTQPTERFLHVHFDRMQAFLASKTNTARRARLGYRLHPTFAALSLIASSILAFAKPTRQNALVIANAVICGISVLSAKTLNQTMMGNRNAKTWTKIQGNACVVSAILAALCPTSSCLQKAMIHWNWALLFAAGFIERMYVLCILSQLNISSKTRYDRYYSPMFQICTLGSVPLGLATFLLCRA